MSATRDDDAVHRILGQWRRERPELDVRSMGPVGRLKRSAALLQKRLDEVFARFGLTSWEFDLLATLRRSGEPYCLAPTTLFSLLMLTSGTMTRQLQQLEARGLIGRLPNPSDARSLLVQLSPQGLALIDQAVSAHVANMDTILAPLSEQEFSELDRALVRLLAILES